MGAIDARQLFGLLDTTQEGQFLEDFKRLKVGEISRPVSKWGRLFGAR